MISFREIIHERATKNSTPAGWKAGPSGYIFRMEWIMSGSEDVVASTAEGS